MILVTGGCGFIGSHTCVELLSSGYSIIVLDNLQNSNIKSLENVSLIAGGGGSFAVGSFSDNKKDFNVTNKNDCGGLAPKDLIFIEGNISDTNLLNVIFSKFDIEAVIHFAGSKSVSESVCNPLEYYRNNFVNSLTLLEIMLKHSCNKFVFSSSATVYGNPDNCPVTEQFELKPLNPYGFSKLFTEKAINDICNSEHNFSAGILRYFNPIGAHPSGLIGENPKGIPNNLIPYIASVAAGKLAELPVFGNDYATLDGTGVRDYIHVVDLARAHVKCLQSLGINSGAMTFNLGTGCGYSVLQIIKAYENVNKVQIPYKILPRRSGDVSKIYADPSLARDTLGWEAEFDLNKMCEDSWRWQCHLSNS